MKLRPPSWNEETWIGIGLLGLIATLFAGFFIFGLTRPAPTACADGERPVIIKVHSCTKEPQPPQRASIGETP